MGGSNVAPDAEPEILDHRRRVGHRPEVAEGMDALGGVGMARSPVSLK